MRITAIILATLSILLVSGLGLLRFSPQLEHAKSMQEVDKMAKSMEKAGVSTADVKEINSLKGKSTRTKVGAYLFLLCGLGGLFVLVTTFLKKTKLIYAGGLGLIVLSVVTLVVNPDYMAGGGAASARSIAWVMSIAAITGAALCLGAEKLRQRKAAKQQAAAALAAPQMTPPAAA